jgi:hypothetical protein
MRTAAFLVKNGIGFGHIRRAFLVAEAIHRAGQLRPILISQARSLALYRDSPAQVINFPLLHRVPSAVTEDFYTELLDRILGRLDPAVVIEDTYPDARYRRLPALADRPRLLLMRRLDGLSFDQLRQRGDLAHYDRILVAQDESSFAEEGHSGDSLAAVRHSGRCTFIGNLAYTPTVDDVRAARQAYAPNGAPLVVVNGGAGGDQMPDGYGDRLFGACQDIAARLAHEGHPGRFVLVTGPYYAGRPLNETSNVTVRRYEPRLAALLAAADVAVIKPGNNALSEALSGQANLVLVPDASFMEGLDEHAARTVAQYGGAVGAPDPASLEPLIRDALIRPPRRTRLRASSGAVDAVVREIHEQATGGIDVSIAAKALLLVLTAPDHLTPESLSADLPADLRGAIVLGNPKRDGAVVNLSALARGQSGNVSAVVWDTQPSPPTPQSVVDQGVHLLILPGPSSAADFWLKGQPSVPSLLTITAETVTARVDIGLVQRRLARLLQRQAVGAMLVDLRLLRRPDLLSYLEALAQWIAGQALRLVGAETIATIKANDLLRGATR